MVMRALTGLREVVITRTDHGGVPLAGQSWLGSLGRDVLILGRHPVFVLNLIAYCPIQGAFGAYTFWGPKVGIRFGTYKITLHPFQPHQASVQTETPGACMTAISEHYACAQAGYELFDLPQEFIDLTFGVVTIVTSIVATLLGGLFIDMVGSSVRNAMAFCGVTALVSPLCVQSA